MKRTLLGERKWSVSVMIKFVCAFLEEVILSENNVYFYRVLHVFYTFIALIDRYKSYGLSANETSRHQS